MRRIAAMGGALLLGLVLPGLVEAQDRLAGRGADLHLFRPAIDSRGHITVNGTDVLPANAFSFGLVLDAGFNILPYDGFQEENDVLSADAERVNHLVGQAFTGRLMFNYGLFGRAIVGIQLPFTLMRGPGVEGLLNDGSPFYNPGPAAGGPVPGLEQQGIGDIVLHGKVRILHADTAPIGLAAVLRMGIPTGDARRFAGEPGFWLWPSIVAEYRPHQRVRFSAELGYRAIFREGSRLNLDARTIPTGTNATGAMIERAGTELRYNDLLTFGLGMSFRVAPTLDLILETYGSQIVTEFGTSGATSAEALLGLKIFVQEHSYLLLAGGLGYPRSGFEAANYRATVSFIFEPAVHDRDGDGIPDDRDGCPDDPEDRDGFEDQDGCPDLDNDEDGIPDVEDQCPDYPEDFDGDEDEDGCPEGGQSDMDGDGILDEADQCPNEREDRDGFQDEDGCPDPDNDSDGILDAQDLCPDEAEDFDGFEDDDGCPEPDNDHDRIIDPDDACPNDPESYNGFEDEDGCPDEGSVVIEDNQLIILQKIYFATDSAQILSRSYPILDAVAATLQGNPQITMIEVQGHADERGADEYNLRLTRDRAASVVEALVQRGVSRDRVRSAGYGELCPVNPAHDRQAWDENRRVEFKIISTVDGPTGVEVACEAGRHLVPD